MTNECSAIEGATDDDMTGMHARKTPRTRKRKCVHACFGGNLGIVSGATLTLNDHNRTFMIYLCFSEKI